MKQRLLVFYIVICVLSLVLPLLIARFGTVHEFFTIACMLVAVFFSLDAFSWFLVRKHQSGDLVLNAIQTIRIAFTTAIVVLINYVAYSKPGPEDLMDWHFWIFSGWTGFCLAYAFFWFAIPRRDLLLLGHVVRTWKMGLPKLRAANQFGVLCTILAVLEFAAVISPTPFDLSREADLLNFVILSAFGLIIFCLVGPIFWIAIRSYYTMGDNCFLSYSRSDGERAQTIRSGLEARGLGCFRDIEGVRAGDEISQTLGEAIANSDVFIPLLSKASLKSSWVRDEIFLAIHYAKLNGSPVIIPARLCELGPVEEWVSGGSDVAAHIKSINILDLSMRDVREAEIDRLAETIRRKTQPDIRH
ncbi:MAG: toll/interleukin-1 receptor domain-containing protein [Gammaproteobacteria bacterium]|nr:toll/interleukin-1 receptor domain-containing protein [Gammaproteobacteria bacterium]